MSGIYSILVKQYDWISYVNILIVLVILLSQCFMSRVFYHLWIVGHKLYCFVDSFHHRHEHQGKCSSLILLNKFSYDPTDSIFRFTHINISIHTYIILFFNVNKIFYFSTSPHIDAPFTRLNQKRFPTLTSARPSPKATNFPPVPRWGR